MPYLRLNRLAAFMLASGLPLLGLSAEIPAMTFLGEGGPHVSGWIDGLMPYYQQHHCLAYADVQFEGSNTSAGILSVGSGYRQQIDQQGILGTYLFYDRVRSGSQEYYNVISPGVEYLTTSWQYRLNYYAPFGKKAHDTASGWADQFGNFSYVAFEGHNEYDERATQHESLSYGGDATVSYRFQNDNRWEVSVSPYAFDRDHDSTLLGSNAQINFYKTNHTQLFLGDGYDNDTHNRVYVGVAFNFGGRSNADTLDNLMVSPVYRNLDLNTTQNGAGVDDYTTYSGTEALEEDNIYFVDNGGANQTTASTPDGTYENPYTSLDSFNEANTAGDVDTEANVWLAGSSNSYTSTDTMTLTDDQDVYGRSADYKQAADAGDVVIASADGMTLQGTNTVSDLTLQGDGTDESIGITVTGTGNATLNNLIVGSNTLANSYQTGVRLDEAGAAATITNSTIRGYADSNYTDSDFGFPVGGAGVIADANTTLVIRNSTISSQTTSGGTYDDGILVDDNATADISNSIITANASDGQAWGIYAIDAGDIIITDSTITSEGSGDSYGVRYGSSAGDLTINDSTINATSTGGSATGIRALVDDSEIEITNSTLNVTGNTAAKGIEVENNAGLNIVTATITGNTINLSGSTETGISTGAGVTVTQEDNTINNL